jgi:hypothetical protein
MSALTTRCTDPKILLASHGASTHVANSLILAYTGEIVMVAFYKINGLEPPL